MKTVFAMVFMFLFLIAKSGHAIESMTQDKKAETLDAIYSIVNNEFYKDERVEKFKTMFEQKQLAPQKNFMAARVSTDFDSQIDALLTVLDDAHTMRVTPTQSAYFELMDIFSYAVTDGDRQRIFPGENRPFYYGIGLIGEKRGDRYFISKLYHGLPAAKTGLKVGDEILSISGATSLSYPAFVSENDRMTRVRIRRAAGANPLTFQVPVVKIFPQEMFLQASLNSHKIIEQDKKKFAYIRLWSGSNGNVFAELKKLLFDSKLSSVDGLILDIRSRWGGANLDDANLFVSNIATTEMLLKDGTIIRPPTSWKKPIVALIDRGTRSGLEIFAYNLQKNGIPLIGETTAGALTAATAFLLPDDSLMMLGIGSILIDGKNLDGIGITPDIEVSNNLPYSAGRDAQLNRAVEVLALN